MRNKKIILGVVLVLALVAFMPVAQAGPIDWFLGLFGFTPGYELPENVQPVEGVISPNEIYKDLGNGRYNLVSYTDNRFVKYGDDWYLFSDLVTLEWHPNTIIDPPVGGPGPTKIPGFNEVKKIDKETMSVVKDFDITPLSVDDPEEQILLWSSPEGNLTLKPYLLTSRGVKKYIGDLDQTDREATDLITNANNYEGSWKFLHTFLRTYDHTGFGMDIDTELEIEKIGNNKLLIEDKYLINFGDYEENNFTFTLSESGISVDLSEFSVGELIILDPTTSQSEAEAFVSADTYTQESTPTTSYANSTLIIVADTVGAQGQREGFWLIDFSNITALTGGTLDLNITDASLNIYQETDGGAPAGTNYDFTYCNVSFNADFLTYSNREANVINHCTATPSDNITDDATSGFKTLNFTNWTHAELEDDQIFTIYGANTTLLNGNYKFFSSKESLTSSQHPYFNISWIVNPSNYTEYNLTYDASVNETYSQTISTIIQHNKTLSITSPKLTFDGDNVSATVTQTNISTIGDYTNTSLNITFDTPLPTDTDDVTSKSVDFYWNFLLGGSYEITGATAQTVNLEFYIDSAEPEPIIVAEGDLINLISTAYARPDEGSFTTMVEVGDENYTQTQESQSINIFTMNASDAEMDLVSTTTNETINGYINVTFDSRTVNRKYSDIGNVILYDINISEQSGTEPISYSITILDEADLSTPVVSDVDTLWTHWNNNPDKPSNTSTTSSGDSTYNYTYDNRTVFPTGLETNATITYGATGYSSRLHFLNEAPLENGTYINVTLYLLATAASDTVTLNVVNTVGQPQSGVNIRVRKHNLGAGTFVQVAEVITNDAGSTVTDLEIDGPFYSFVLVVDDVVRRTINPFVVSDTSLTFVLPPLEDYVDDLATSQGIQTDLTFSETTNITTYTFNNPAGADITGCLRITKIDNLDGDQIDYSCEESSSGSVTFNMTGQTTGTYQAQGSLQLASGTIITDTLEIDFREASPYGLNGVAAAIFLIGIAAFTGLWNPVAMIVLTTLAVFAAGMLGLIALPAGAVIGLMCIAMIFIFRLKT